MKPIDILMPGRRAIMDAGVCVTCGGPAVDFEDDLSRRENEISGMCQVCQDDVFREQDDLPEPEDAQEEL